MMNDVPQVRPQVPALIPEVELQAAQRKIQANLTEFFHSVALNVLSQII